MTGKLTKKDLKGPTFLQVQTARLMEFISRHRSKLLVFLVFAAVLATVAAGWSLYRMNYEKSAYEIYNQVQMAALNSDAKGQNAKIIAELSNVTSKYPGSQAALYAYYDLGALYLKANQIDLSLRANDEFIKRARSGNFLKTLAYRAKGYAYEARKDYQKALESFGTALKSPEGKIFEGLIYRDMARIYEEMQDNEKSVEYYRKSLEKTTDPSMEMIIKRKIASLS